MKIYEILKADLNDEYHLLEKIKKNCKPYLMKYSSVKIYRGMHNKESIVHKTVHLQNRTPANTPQAIHDLLNDAFIAEFGHPFRNALFGIGDLVTAKNYGNPYVIIPEGNFHYAWSPVIRDMYDMFENPRNAIDSSHRGVFSDIVYKHLIHTDEYRNYIKNVIQRKAPSNWLAKNLDSPDPALAFRTVTISAFSRPFIKDNSNILLNVFRQLIREFYKMDEGLKQWGLKYQKNEIMIICDKYYGVEAERPNLYKKLVDM